MVNLLKEDGTIKVECPFNSLFSTKAKGLKGIWKDKKWVFSEEVEDLVKELLLEVYGDDGSGVEYESVEIDLDVYKHDNKAIKACNLVLIERLHRDKPPMLSKHTIVAKGGFAPHGGSSANPRVSAETGTVIRTKLPISIVEKIRDLDGVTVLGSQNSIEKELEKIEKEIEILLKKKEEILAKINK